MLQLHMKSQVKGALPQCVLVTDVYMPLLTVVRVIYTHPWFWSEWSQPAMSISNTHAVVTAVPRYTPNSLPQIIHRKIKFNMLQLSLLYFHIRCI